MRRYEDYQEVELKYFEIIPSNWTLGRLCDVLSSRAYSFTGGPFGSDLKSNDYTDDGVRIIQLQNIGIGRFLNDYKIYTSEEKANALLACNIYPGDIIIAKMADPVARATIIPDYHSRYLMASDGIRLVNNNFNDSRFLVYAINSIHFNFYASINSVGSTRQRIGLNVLKKLNIILPTLEEQQAIANYLDAKTSAIDKKVTLLEQKIETYKKLKRTLINQTITKGLRSLSEVEMKDSGISWIGQIPKHWEVKRFKDVVKIVNGYAFKSNDFSDAGLSVLRISDITKSDFSDLKKVPLFYKTLAKESKVLKEDILMAMTGATIGKNSFFNGNDTLYLNQRVCSFRAINKNQLLPLYFSLFISSDFVQNLIKLIAGGSAQENISKSQLEVFEIVLPPKSEQEEIANYLDHKTATIDAITSNISKQIDTLKQLRKTVINDVVTGKIKVVE